MQNIRYYLRYYKNWIISILIFTVLFFLSVLLSYEWSLRFLQINTPLVFFVVESLSHTLFIYASVIICGLALVVLTRWLGFFRKKDIEILLKVTTDELRAENKSLCNKLDMCVHVLMQASIGIVLTRAERVVLANEAMSVFNGKVNRKMKGMSVYSLFPVPSEVKALLEKSRLELLENKAWSAQMMLTTHTGTRTLYHIKAFYLNTDQPKKGIVWCFQDYSAEARSIEIEKYYQTVFRVLSLLHHFKDEEDEYELLQQMLNEIIGIYGLKTAFFQAYQNKRLITRFIAGDDSAFPRAPKEMDLQNPQLKNVAPVRAFLTQKGFGYNDIQKIPYYQKNLARKNKKPVLSTYAFPVILEGRVEGVITFYGHAVGVFTESLIFRLQQLISEICENISAIGRRRRTQLAIGQYEERLRAQIQELESNKRVMLKQANEVNRIIQDLVKARDAAEAANKAKSDFLSHMSHELRTPLNAILGFSEAMESETFGTLTNPQYKEYAQYIYSSGQYLLSLINDILDLSCIESGNKNLEDKKISVKNVLENVIEIVRKYPGGSERKISLSVEKPRVSLKADERAFKQILLNVLSNAIKFTNEKGMIDIKVSLTSRQEMEIDVVDNGVGIPKDKMKLLFQPFTQIENVMTRTHQGTGLGLVLVKRLMELHQGQVFIESAYGQGSKISLIFPSKRVTLTAKRGTK